MADVVNVDRIVEEAAIAALSRAVVRRVETVPTALWDGSDGLNVLIVISDDARPLIGGDEAVEVIFAIHQALLTAGDNSSPIVSFATEEEIAADELLAAQDDVESRDDNLP